eukprot:TRINITY_DN17519_c0_g1_i1.p1 TRINITY_DN17519_c0_g1~~TRINITY_DN17519_c0_g1_i1.p1  ORF type:complete len:398 (-),score=60.34 TRINITY_DN17519_c0_g1_i1:134-1327(-)
MTTLTGAEDKPVAVLPVGGPGALLLYTGKLQRHGQHDDMTVIGEEGRLASAAFGRRSAAAVARFAEVREERLPVEDDLILEDYDSDRDGDSLAPLPRLPGAFTGRKLMLARAQRCVVCLGESEHTFVPPHGHTRCGTGCAGSSQASTTSPSSGSRSRGPVEGHRFCTDCWDEFLEHHMEDAPDGKRRVLQLSKLICPVCRDPIEMPELWTVRLGLHQARCRRSSSRIPSLAEATQLPHRTEVVVPLPAGQGGELTPSDFWARRRSGRRHHHEDSSDSSEERVTDDESPQRYWSPKSCIRAGDEQHGDTDGALDFRMPSAEDERDAAEVVNVDVVERPCSLPCWLPVLLTFLLLVVAASFAIYSVSVQGKVEDLDDWALVFEDDGFSGFFGMDQGVLL